METWFNGVFWSKQHGDFADHDPVTEEVYARFRMSFVALWRHPARRAVSWYQSKYLHLDNTQQRQARFVNGTKSLLQAAKYLEGKVTLLLGGPQRAGMRLARPHSTEAAFAVAKRRPASQPL